MMSDESLAALLGEVDLHAGGEPSTERVTIRYKHKKISRFACGEDNKAAGHYRFEFIDHILTITGTPEEVEAKNEEFLRMAKGFMTVDKLNIVRLKEIENEMSLDDESIRVVRGIVDTANVSDRPADSMAAAPAAPATGFRFKVGG